MSSSVPHDGNLGTAIYINNKVFHDKVILNNDELQISAIKLQLETNNTFIIYNLYNQPNKNYDLNNLPRLIDLQHPVLIMGDFNAHNPIWDQNCSSPDQNGIVIEQFINSNNLCCLNNNELSTYYSKTHGTFSAIDVSLCSPTIIDRFEWHVSDDLYSSDHFPILISFLSNNPEPHNPRYNIHKADWEKYKLLSRDIPPFEVMRDHNETNEFLTKFIRSAADKSIPITTPHPNKQKVPWWSETLSELIAQKHSIGRRLDTLNRRYNNLNKNRIDQKIILKMVTIVLEIDTLKPLYNKLSAKFRKEVIQGKIISWRKYVSSLSSHTPIKQIWEKLRKINGKFNTSSRHAIINNGSKIIDTYEICNILGDNFEKVSSNNSLDEHFRKIKSTTEKIPLNFETLEDIYYNRRFSMIEFEYALSTCDNSAPGKDNICFEMIKNLAPLAKSYLLQFYNHLWIRNLFPIEWRKAVIIPIQKPGKDPSNKNNYRPISLTSCMCKLLEKMVNARLTWHIRENKILSPTQFGSQMNRSTIDSLSHLEDYVRRRFERKQITVALFFDIQKAYDTTWRYSILKTLYDNNFKGHLPIFIKNFVAERTFQVRIDNVYSKNFTLDNGVPQGSVLSGTLFTLAINNIVSQLPTGVMNNLYMDDFTMYYAATNLRHAERILNNAITKIDSWAISVGFRFSIEKTQAILFYRDVRWKKGEDITLKIRDYVIPINQTVKFLGLIFDTHLNWKAHIAYTKAKCKNALNLLKKLSHTNWGADRHTLMMLYKTTVLSILDYGSQIYGSASEAALRILDPIHNEGLRISTGAFRSSPTKSVQVESGEPPLALHRDLVTMRSAIKIQSSDSPTKDLFNERDIFINNHPPSFPIRANRLLDSVNENIIFPQIIKFPPPWLMHKVRICTHLYFLSKKYTYTPDHHKQHTIEHIRRKGNHFAIYTDGSKSQIGVGYAAISTSKNLQFSLPDRASVFTAELSAIWSAIDIIKEQPSQKFVIYSDSRSSIEALQNYCPKNPLVQQIKYEFHKLYEDNKYVELCWIPAHIGIKGNEDADKAAKEAINMSRSNINIPVSDFITTLKRTIFNKWQTLWNEEHDDNKLKQIKPTIGIWSSSFQKERRIEVMLSRLRIGHTLFTHGYLMKNPHDPIPECPQCRTTLTVKHIFNECPIFERQRRSSIGNKTIKEILSESPTFSVYTITKFLKNCNLFNKI